LNRFKHGNGKKYITLTEKDVTAYLLRRDKIEERTAGEEREKDREI
jgi:hypothetical protein